MTVLHVLWLPILLSAVFVFVASALIHMALSWWHKSDYTKLPQEEKVMEALRSFGLPPGDYFAPLCANMSEMKTPEFKEKMNKGPVLTMTVMPNGQMNMGKSLGLWFVYVLVVSYLAGYVAAHALPVGPGRGAILKIAGVSSFLGYAGALWQMSIWYRRSWLTTIKTTVDGAIYAAVTAYTFACFWPR
jgi:hypothetical protein